ncbi:hypothetical protein GCM10010218_11430 [Streptomyces mashuensis]|uniref:Uncharacterized protein n=1 Tax=Streptomyces mashuensis TaxID=33904 RepID=A0A919EB41_9ACTN|nr:hypothetical protein [Streptomyces mashuensis]GHF32163.1 hypothetical protein GCM10010218_11430 [Streptomyces mashuensis]
MPKTVNDVTSFASPPSSADPLAGLRRDCARMAPHWAVPAGTGRDVGAGGTGGTCGTAWSLIHGISVPDRSARLLDGMSEYGD